MSRNGLTALPMARASNHLPGSKCPMPIARCLRLGSMFSGTDTPSHIPTAAAISDMGPTELPIAKPLNQSLAAKYPIPVARLLRLGSNPSGTVIPSHCLTAPAISDNG